MYSGTSQIRTPNGGGTNGAVFLTGVTSFQCMREWYLGAEKDVLIIGVLLEVFQQCIGFKSILGTSIIVC